MDQQRVKELIDLLSASDLTELTLRDGGWALSLFRAVAPCQPLDAAPAALAPAAAIPVTATATPTSASREVCSPLYGILHLTPSPQEPPFVAVGSTVVAGQTLCVVEAMKMFHQVTAPTGGRIEALLAEAGLEVDSGQPLFRIVESE